MKTSTELQVGDVIQIANTYPFWVEPKDFPKLKLMGPYPVPLVAGESLEILSVPTERGGKFKISYRSAIYYILYVELYQACQEKSTEPTEIKSYSTPK